MTKISFVDRKLMLLVYIIHNTSSPSLSEKVNKIMCMLIINLLPILQNNQNNFFYFR